MRTGNLAASEEALQCLRPGDAYLAPAGPAIFHLICGKIEMAAFWVGKAFGLLART